MRVLLKLVLDCPPDAAWKAIRTPAVFRAVSAPLTTFESLEVGGFPEMWGDGEHRVVVRALGLVTIGEQVIDVGVSIRPSAYSTSGKVSTSSTTGSGSTSGGVRIMRDTGRGVTGQLALITKWEHSMAIAEAPGGKTLYRDQLKFEAGAVTPLLWPVYWAFWQWRALGMKRLAKGWRA